MKKHWFLAALLLLTVLNLAAFSSLAWRRWCAHCSKPVCCQEAPAAVLGKQLDLTPEQSIAMDSLHTCFTAAAQVVAAEMKQEQIQLTQELMKDQPDSAVITAVLHRISERHHELSRATVDHLLAQKKRLTPEQQKKLFGMVLNRCAMNPSACIQQPTH
ncbi:MAG TPA: periplasmic heavy metal sensor [bacterium]|nr:periplasmic heavy metal sensor [bacterium]HQG45885.1 periplasmic heavy metal sensor [bacterium]HQI48341.1 periplasmic heavy metal sensor [bacterium]HQJ63443.1 periplasmic heavy metal sensor [bacterium]